MSTYEKTLIPPLNFSMVASGVYRSGFPNRKNHAFLQELGLKSVLCVSAASFLAELPLADDLDAISQEPFISINPDSMADALRHLLDVRNHPILVHCTKGTVRQQPPTRGFSGMDRRAHCVVRYLSVGARQHRTGCVIGCMRKMENWSLTSIIDEYCRFAGPRMRLLDQQFIEFFTPTIQYDERQKPKWIF
ncbi:hypothetical protein BBJ28_00019772 [Nothophytophthora sp. Chile5]|nr:hypothetical protein BBJ28_00019772 [Nothophytophthora sp. Chile5]